jgi:hypothetical protein
MNRSRMLIALATLALIGLAVWTYSSGSVDNVGSAAGPAPTSAGSGSAPPTTSRTPSTKKSPPTTAPAPTTTIAANPQAYATALFRYWEQRDRDNAAKVATPAVVATMFGHVWHKGDAWMAQGCKGAAGSTSCTWGKTRRHFVLKVRNPTGGMPPLVVAFEATH